MKEFSAFKNVIVDLMTVVCIYWLKL